ncbi:hypothetical protein AURDEDRAFT_146783 [Auricularia subglabra TFB-10046 SS5]|nr:hypothetical protein AURDEDRAFT_146783 [Auricularia subglabra TFB-10046 SS5]
MNASPAALLPLPPGWAEHAAPDGTPYYYHRASNTSTYVRPVLPGAKPVAPAKKEKERPRSKRPVPGTEWLRVETTAGNVFWTHSGRKASVWTVPEEIKDIVAQLDAQGWEEREEIERVKSEALAAAAKRKASETRDPESNKRARVEDASDSDEEGRRRPPPKKKVDQGEVAAEALGVKDKVDKTLLQEKDINPLLPWDTSLPQFIHDPRYALLPSVTHRKEVFDEYCRTRARQLREQKAAASTSKQTPEQAYDALLERTCTSTRTTFTEWRRGVKKERAFLEYGRSEREREARFKHWLKVLGERKRKDRERAEKDFFDLLRETSAAGDPSEDGKFKEWKDAKRATGLATDPRYDAVGSSSLREELYGTFVRVLQREQEGDKGAVDPEAARKERAARAERERAAKVRAQQEKINEQTSKARAALGSEEAENEFMSLLTDAVRDVTTWDEALRQLESDPRFAATSNAPKRRLFEAHVNRLREKHLRSLHALFEAHSPTLDAAYPGESVQRSSPAEKLRFSGRDVHAEWTRWTRERQTKARAEFDEMLRENSFLEFWGRVRKLGGEGAAAFGSDDEGEGEEGGGTADLKALAKDIGLEAVVDVLQNDKRYIVWAHMPEERERWIREYLERMEPPKLSVHVPEHEG